MANKKRGYYTLNIGGKNRTMHFSMNFWANFTDNLGITIEKIGDVFKDGNEIDYNEFKVGMWLEDLNPDQLSDIISSMMESRILGNDLNMGINRKVTKTTKVGKPKAN